MVRQKVTFTLEYDESNGKLEVKLAFTPPLAGEKSKERAKMTEGEKHMQNYAATIGSHVMEALASEAA